LDAELFGRKVNLQISRINADGNLCWSLSSKICVICGLRENEKKKVAFPRRTWQINPVTRVKESRKKYSGLRAFAALR
jgi:hypothetical protein